MLIFIVCFIYWFIQHLLFCTIYVRLIEENLRKSKNWAIITDSSPESKKSSFFLIFKELQPFLIELLDEGFLGLLNHLILRQLLHPPGFKHILQLPYSLLIKILLQIFPIPTELLQNKIQKLLALIPHLDDLVLEIHGDVLDHEVECGRVALKGVGVLAPVFDKAQDFVDFQPVLQLLPVVLKCLLVLLDDHLLGGGEVVELFQDLAQLATIWYVLWVQLGDYLLA